MVPRIWEAQMPTRVLQVVFGAGGGGGRGSGICVVIFQAFGQALENADEEALEDGSDEEEDLKAPLRSFRESAQGLGFRVGSML